MSITWNQKDSSIDKFLKTYSEQSEIKYRYHNSNVEIVVVRKTNDDLCWKYNLSAVERDKNIFIIKTNRNWVK